MTRSAPVALALLLSGPAFADDSSTWLDEAYSLLEEAELELIKEAVKEVIVDVIGYESDQVMLAVCDDFVIAYEQEKEAEEAAAEEEARLNETAEETLEEIAEDAFSYYADEHVLRDGSFLDRMFPTDVSITSTSTLPDTNGWICNYDAAPCGTYSEDDEETSRWLKLQGYHFDDVESANTELRICYATSGVNGDAELFVRTESDVECDGSYSVHELHGYFDDNWDFVQDTSTSTETEVVENKADDDSSTSAF